MLKITLPGGFLRERAYAIHVLCYEFLGLQYLIESAKDVDWYSIEFGGKEIRIQDHFFSRYTADGMYLHLNAIPETAHSAKTSGLMHIMCIYGTDAFSQTDNTLDCGVDMIAGAFFMLTRWEEYVNTSRDQHGRFPATASLASRAGFLHRPVVNEYAALLKSWLIQMGVKENMFKRRALNFSVHCDVDTARYWPSYFSIFNKILFRLVKQGSFSGAWNEVKEFVSFLKSGHDPYDTYDILMDLAERNGAKATFCFLVDKAHNLDGRQLLHVPYVKSIFRRIMMRGHRTGVHWSYLTADRESLMTSESMRYQKETGEQAQFARQHFLRCAVPKTWSAWEAAEVTNDFTMGYPESAGFRCGSCYPFPLFDISTSRLLHVYERPLVAMDVTFRFYNNDTPEQAIESVKLLMETVRKYDGEFVLLWHNSSFSGEWKGWEDVPHRILNTNR